MRLILAVPDPPAYIYDIAKDEGEMIAYDKALTCDYAKGGTKTVNFTISAKGFFWWWRK